MSTELTTTDKADYKKLKAEAIENFTKTAEHYQKCVDQLMVIKRRELWRAEHKSWSAFLDDLAEKLGKSPRRLFQMIRAEEVRFKLLKEVQQTLPILRKNIEKMTPQALLEAGKAAPEERLKVVEEATKQFTEDKPPTAPAVAAAAKTYKPPGKEKPAAQLDSTGTKIPAPALPFWERRNEVQPWLNQISEIKVAIEKARAAGDSLYSWIGTPAIDALQNAYTTIANAKLYAVCTKCEGWWDKMSGGGCSTCHNTGLISKHQYDVCSPKELKAIREKANRARL